MLNFVRSKIIFAKRKTKVVDFKILCFLQGKKKQQLTDEKEESFSLNWDHSWDNVESSFEWNHLCEKKKKNSGWFQDSSCFLQRKKKQQFTDKKEEQFYFLKREHSCDNTKLSLK